MGCAAVIIVYSNLMNLSNRNNSFGKNANVIPQLHLGQSIKEFTK